MPTLPSAGLGSRHIEVTRVGFGAWAIGGHGWAFSWGSQDDDQSIGAIRRAVDLGVGWIDTAAVYGIGHSEEVVGRALKDIPTSDRPMVFTKGGRFVNPHKPTDPPWSDLRPESIRREIEGSLRRLGVERIDLYQIHWPEKPEVTPLEESWGQMARLVDEGKARAIGVSNFTVELLERIERIRHVDSLQPPFSLIRRGSVADVIPWAAAHGTGVIVYSPMQAGILTDGFSRERIAGMLTGLFDSEAFAHAFVGAGESLANWWLEHPEESKQRIAQLLMDVAAVAVEPV
jgi:aryl-alcohol dehydrogenase-like predicted oxidoreductase